MSLKTIRNITLGIAISIIIFTSGYNLGLGNYNGIPLRSSKNYQLTGTRVPADKNIDFSQFWEVWGRVEEKYLDKKAIDPTKMVQGAISGMVASLGDPYTVYLPPKENKDAKDDLGGHFEGIGAQLGIKDKKIIVVAPLKGTPAEAAGLKPGDWIVKIDGKETFDLTLPEAVSKIRGMRGSKVVLNILHKNEDKPKDVSIVRDTIKVASVERETKELNGRKVAWLKLTRFGDTTNDEWDKAVGEIARDYQVGKISALILDMRNNPGGYLSGAVYIASEFLDGGKVVIQENTGGFKQNYDTDRQGKLLIIPMDVLINKGSASASEIVAGALRDRKRAKLVGEQSFGKGTIQEAQDLPGGAGLHITTAKWLTPNETWVNSTGLTPDLKVENDDTKPNEDLQLQKALELLVK